MIAVSTKCNCNGSPASAADPVPSTLENQRTRMRIEPRLLPDTLPFLGDLPPLLTRLYAARGVLSEAELDKSLARLIPYQQLKGIDAAVDLLVVALEQRHRILIVGDFDADGATARSEERRVRERV